MPFLKFDFGDKQISFNAEVNAKKTFKDFCEHEKHHGLTPEQLKEVHDACKAGKKPEPKNAETKAAEPAADK